MGCSRLSPEFYTRWASEFPDGLTDDDLISALELMRRSGFEMVAFYGRDSEFEPAEFVNWVREKNKLFFILYRTDDTPLSAIWFAPILFQGAQAFAHFCTFSTGEYQEYVRGGRLLLKFVGATIKQALGKTPVCYRHALKMAYDLGFEKLTILEGTEPIRGKFRDAVLSINNIATLEV